jgi:hypothetical protein
MLSLYGHAVEQLIALGADVGVTLEQWRMFEWGPQSAPCKLSMHAAETLWRAKINNLYLMQAAAEHVYDSLFGLIHLAVRCDTCVTISL